MLLKTEYTGGCTHYYCDRNTPVRIFFIVSVREMVPVLIRAGYKVVVRPSVKEYKFHINVLRKYFFLSKKHPFQTTCSTNLPQNFTFTKCEFFLGQLGSYKYQYSFKLDSFVTRPVHITFGQFGNIFQEKNTLGKYLEQEC